MNEAFLPRPEVCLLGQLRLSSHADQLLVPGAARIGSGTGCSLRFTTPPHTPLEGHSSRTCLLAPNRLGTPDEDDQCVCAHQDGHRQQDQRNHLHSVLWALQQQAWGLSSAPPFSATLFAGTPHPCLLVVSSQHKHKAMAEQFVGFAMSHMGTR